MIDLFIYLFICILLEYQNRIPGFHVVERHKSSNGSHLQGY